MPSCRSAQRLSTIATVALLSACSSGEVPGIGEFDSRTITKVSLVNTIEDPDTLDFVVKSEVYPEDPNTLYACSRTVGISVYDVSNPESPQLLSRWKGADRSTYPEADEVPDVEGQARIGNTLIVVGRLGQIHLFDVSDPAQLKQVGFLHLDVEALPEHQRRWGAFGALHTQVYSPDGKRNIAIVTATFSSHLVAVDITHPEAPTVVSKLKLNQGQLGTEMTEGISIQDSYAYVGGFASNQLHIVDVADPSHMKIVNSLQSGELYIQMVSELNAYYPNILFAGAWGNPGGLVTFDISDPTNTREIGRIVSEDLYRSNRVRIRGKYAYVPLEQDGTSGFGIIDISTPSDLKHVGTLRGIPGITGHSYTLALVQDYVYMFGGTAPTLAILKIHKTDGPAQRPIEIEIPNGGEGSVLSNGTFSGLDRRSRHRVY